MSQATATRASSRIDYGRWISLIAFVAAIGGAVYTYPKWEPRLKEWMSHGKADDPHDHGASGDNHAHGATQADPHNHASEDPAHASSDSLEITPQARASIGLKVAQLKPRAFDRSVSLPGVVVEVRGRSRIAVVSPMTGIVTKILHLEGESVLPGKPLFEVRLTQEDLVQSQSDLLKTVFEIDVVQKEINRLEQATKEGGLAGRTLLERQYEKQRQEGILRAQRQALLLHGLSESQIDEIVRSRVLLSTMTIRAPNTDPTGKERATGVPLQIQKLEVDVGQAVPMGTPLALLSDFSQLLIEGQAFEHDVESVSRALADGKGVEAVFESVGGKHHVVNQLPIQHISNSIHEETHTAHVYIAIKNELASSTESPRRFEQWRYKPGQHLTLRIPVERWEEKLVLPTEAVAVDGVENYVFLAHGDHLDRRAVKVEYRDPLWVVITPDEQVGPGKIVAISGAQQLHLALKNKSGGEAAHDHGHEH